MIHTLSINHVEVIVLFSPLSHSVEYFCIGMLSRLLAVIVEGTCSLVLFILLAI